MKNNNKRIIKILLVISILIITILLYIGGIFNPYIENILNETPQAKVTEFVNAISQKNRTKAFDLWKLPENYDTGKLNDLKERKEKITSELLNKNISSRFVIENIELWRTCCMLGIINDYKGAGGARLRVKLISENNAELYYNIDVFTRETTYFGDAAGYPVRNWVIRDIYMDGDSPIFWTQRAN